MLVTTKGSVNQNDITIENVDEPNGRAWDELTVDKTTWSSEISTSLFQEPLEQMDKNPVR